MMDDFRATAWDLPTRDHSQFDAFVFIIFSHGDSNDATFSVPPVCSGLASEGSWVPLLQLDTRWSSPVLVHAIQEKMIPLHHCHFPFLISKTRQYIFSGCPLPWGKIHISTLFPLHWKCGYIDNDLPLFVSID